MGCVEPPRVKDRCTSADMGQLGFHDCRVSGIRWDASRFEVAFDLDYIVEWVAPMDGDGSYRFWISPAELRFANVDDVRIELEWSSLALQCSVRDLHRRGKRITPSGEDQWCWELELSEPEGRIVLWATDFELNIHAAPTLCATQELGRRDP